MAHFPPASIHASEVRTLQSQANDQEYLISVALPFHYHERPERTYPVIYVLDANLFFGMVTDMVRVMNVRVPFCNELPDAIIAGIGYPAYGSLADSHARWMHLRMRDFLAARDEWAENFIKENFPVPNPLTGGGADGFLQFIQAQVVPLVESEYRADPSDRILMGHSWGGLFALYSLFHQPNLFQRYVVVSAEPTFADEQEYAERHDNLPVHMYLANGELEMDDEQQARFEAFASVLNSRGYPDLSLTHAVIPGCKHCAVVAPAYRAGLEAVFEEPVSSLFHK